MKFKIYNDSFPLVLIRASAIAEIFDQEDMLQRQNSQSPVLDRYHINWIHNDIILVPSFYICGDKAKVGMGRHRLTMLSRHMEAIPAAYERRFSGSDDLDSILNRIVLREMAKLEEFEYPDFPIENLGEDINGGEEWKRSLEYQRT